MPAGRAPALVEIGPDSRLDLETGGVHGRLLAELARAGAPLAPSWVLTADAFRDHVRDVLQGDEAPQGLARALHRAEGSSRAAVAHAKLAAAPLDAALLGTVAALAGGARAAYCVRASSTTSWRATRLAPALEAEVAARAGDLCAAITEVWCATFEEPALATLRILRARDVGVAVVLVALDDVRRLRLLVRDAELERGRARARSETQPWFLQETRAAARHGAERRSAAWVDPTSLCALDLRAASGWLDEGIIERLAAIAAPLVRGLPQLAAIDFALAADGELRVVGGQGLDEQRRDDARGAFTRAGFGESLPGVPTELTWSVGRGFSEAGVKGAITSLGGTLASDARLVERVRGRPYLELETLVPALAGVPGLDASSLIGLVDARHAPEIVTALGLAKERPTLAGFALTVARIATLQTRLTRELATFEAQADEQRRWLSELDLAILPDDALRTTLRESRAFYERTGRLLAACAVGALATHAGLEAVLERAFPVTARRVARAVTAGVGDLATAEPAFAVGRALPVLRRDPAAASALVAGARTLADVPRGTGRRALEELLHEHGDRAIRESDLSTPRWGERPHELFAMVTSALAGEDTSIDDRQRRVRANADRARADLDRTLGIGERQLARALVDRARQALALRERMRVWMARTLGIFRIVALDEDRRLRRLDPALVPGGAFECTLGELEVAAQRGRTDLAPLAAWRRRGRERLAALPDPPDAFVGAPPLAETMPPASRELVGSAASGGIATGPARVIGPNGEGLDRVQAGDVVVVYAPDVCLGPVLWHAGALVATVGSAMSHIAAVARELGVPAVLGVPSCHELVTPGERLRVDGGRGVVERVEP